MSKKLQNYTSEITSGGNSGIGTIPVPFFLRYLSCGTKNRFDIYKEFDEVFLYMTDL